MNSKSKDKDCQGVIPPNYILKILKYKALILHTSSKNPHKESSPNEAGFQSSILISILYLIRTSSTLKMDQFPILTLNSANPLSSQKAGKTKE